MVNSYAIKAVKAQPSAQSIKNILNYSKSLEALELGGKKKIVVLN